MPACPAGDRWGNPTLPQFFPSDLAPNWKRSPPEKTSQQTRNYRRRCRRSLSLVTPDQIFSQGPARFGKSGPSRLETTGRETDGYFNQPRGTVVLPKPTSTLASSAPGREGKRVRLLRQHRLRWKAVADRREMPPATHHTHHALLKINFQRCHHFSTIETI